MDKLLGQPIAEEIDWRFDYVIFLLKPIRRSRVGCMIFVWVIFHVLVARVLSYQEEAPYSFNQDLKLALDE